LHFQRWKELQVVGDWIGSLISFEGILYRGYKPLSEVLIESTTVGVLVACNPNPNRLDIVVTSNE